MGAGPAAIAASTLTTIAAFGPIVIIEGAAGALFRELALAVTFSLLASLLVALTLLPALASRLLVRSRAINLTVTNVPGPQFPLYCLGAKVLEAFPYVCVVDRMAMIIAVLSYDGQLGFGLSGDRSAVPDLVDLAAAIEAGFAELEEALLPAEAATGTKAGKKAAAAGRSTAKGARAKSTTRRTPKRSA